MTQPFLRSTRIPHLTYLLAATVAMLCLANSPSAHANDAPVQLKRGDTPPATLGYTRTNDLVETTQFAGKVLVVTFWATWCAPCRAEISYLEGLQRKVSKDILQVVAVNIEDRDVFRDATRKMHEFQILIANDRTKRSSESYGVKGIPHMVIIGKDGKVAAVHRGYSEASIPKLAEQIVAELYVGVKKAPNESETNSAPTKPAPPPPTSALPSPSTASVGSTVSATNATAATSSANQ